jgi:hypothetical protein
VSAPEPHGQFIVRESFSISGGGTCVGGYVSSGVVHTGDRLAWFDGVSDRHGVCHGVAPVRTVPMLTPTVALTIPATQPIDFSEGTMISAYASG